MSKQEYIDHLMLLQDNIAMLMSVDMSKDAVMAMLVQITKMAAKIDIIE